MEFFTLIGIIGGYALLATPIVAALNGIFQQNRQTKILIKQIELQNKQMAIQIKELELQNRMKTHAVLEDFYSRYQEISSKIKKLRAYNNPELIPELTKEELEHTAILTERFFRLKYSQWLVGEEQKLVEPWLQKKWEEFTKEAFGKPFFQKMWQIIEKDFMPSQKKFHKYINKFFK